MAKYFKFVYDADAGISESLLVDSLQYIHQEDLQKLAFIPADFNEGGVVKLTLNQEDPRRKIKTYLEEQWEILMSSNQTFVEIPIRELPVTESVECDDNAWAEWVIMVGFDPTDCNVILSATIEPEGLGTITIGDSFVNPITGSSGNWYATATGTPCGTQDIAFLQSDGDCADPGTPVLIPGIEEYYYTGKMVTCEPEGGEPVMYCLIAKKVFNTVGFSGTLSFNKLTVL